MNKIIVNASNLHVGGGVQVAASFISEIAESWRSKISIVASSEVVANVRLDDMERAQFVRFERINVHGFSPKTGRLDRFMRGGVCVFTVFGPVYRWWTKYRSIVGFAQPWIIYPHNECYTNLPALQRVRTRLKYWLQGLFFRRADLLVVELEHVKEGLIRELGIKPECIHVVHNCVSSTYLDETVWLPIDVPQAECDLRLGFLGRNYMHKNTAIFPAIAEALEAIHGIKARFYVTFTDAEWKACSPGLRAVCVNVGPLSVAQCPSFYKAIDGVVFPSLLECFSATPLEAMAMGKPLFASDRPFNHDVCNDHAHYFDPLSPESAATEIARVFANGGPNKEALRAARAHAVNFSSPKERAGKYLAMLMQCANVTNT